MTTAKVVDVEGQSAKECATRTSRIQELSDRRTLGGWTCEFSVGRKTTCTRVS